MKPESNAVIKYFDLIDEFIKVRACSEELLAEVQRQPVTNKASYRRRVVSVCIPDFATEILAAIKRLDEEYEIDIVEELLYQVCIDVNPSLEIHQVSLPNPGSQPQDGELVQRTQPGERQSLFRKVLGLERALRGQIVGSVRCV